MQNAAIEKLSPVRHLTPEQTHLIQRIKEFIATHKGTEQPAVFVIHGDAGTGKSVILSHLFFQLQQASRDQTSPLYQTNNYFLVNHPELLKVYRQLAGGLPDMLKKNFERPTTLINRVAKTNEHIDVTIVDEAHLLLSQPDHYNNFYGHDQLTELLKLTKVLILVFDEHQVLRTKSFWTPVQLKKRLAPYPTEWAQLKQQFRMTASPSLLNWINAFTGDGELFAMDQSFTSHYDFRIFSDAEAMRQTIIAKNNQVGLSRIVATTGYPSVLDGGKHYIEEGDFRLPWDQYNHTATPWAEIPSTINEVGSIYTVQGFDLNYVGLILGPPVQLAPDGHHVVIDPAKNTDVASFKGRALFKDDHQYQSAEIQMIRNSVNVLMKRGVSGLYIFAHDPALSQKLLDDYNAIV
ncbi:DUF2075 domain-containing protein [uncultured Secundilactobacillus sp.]|uniref:DUF2075 domain-containing protein n=2 Tax=uncultured Secundilactobacillus sp. TaxID=2813935 RepID=UPI00258CC4DD|nr:DUF2075 domain-containing protein [uncultured Secundilactobacillus sp.]